MDPPFNSVLDFLLCTLNGHTSLTMSLSTYGSTAYLFTVSGCGITPLGLLLTLCSCVFLHATDTLLGKGQERDPYLSVLLLG